MMKVRNPSLLDDLFGPQPHRFDGCEHTRQYRSNWDAISATAKDLAPFLELWSILSDMLEVKENLGFRMKDSFFDQQISKNMNTYFNCRWHLSQDCSISHQL